MSCPVTKIGLMTLTDRIRITEAIESVGSAKFIGAFESGSPEWHAARAGIGGSDVGVILGKSQFKSPYTLWCQKSNLLDDLDSTIPMRLGTALEPAIRQFFIDENKDWLTVHETGTWQSTQTEWMKANPDGIIEWADGTLGVLEIKHSAIYVTEIPESWKYQVLWYLMVLGLKRGVVCAVIGGRYTEFEVVWDESLIEEMKTAVWAFYGFVQDGLAPDFDGANSTYETVRELSEGLVEGEIDLGNFWVDLAAAKAIYDVAEQNFTKHKTAVLAFMNGVKYGNWQGERVVALQARNGKPYITFK
jgi:putative phage-type endonuclease